jgi:addiction module HigA family antidote
MRSEDISVLKGIHPGIVLERELRKRNLSKGHFAIALNEFPQTIGAITNGKRKMNTPLALKIEHALGIEEGFFMILQVYYDIKEEKHRQNKQQHPDLTILRPVLFWDTQIQKIDWIEQKKAIIKRVFERGNEEEKAEMRKFYGSDTVDQVIKEQSLI